MRRHRTAEVILPMLALPLLLIGLAMLALPTRAASDPSAIDASYPPHAGAAPAKRKPTPVHFSLIPRSLLP